MASSLLALLDDIATLLDDVALLSKTAASKTAGVLGDDLALNAQQLAGLSAAREIPVVWAVARGSFVNKAILVPAAMLISIFLPLLVLPLLMLGGAYLCFEGFEKLAHKLAHSRDETDAEHAQITDALMHAEVDLVAFEREKIRGAIRTDFILSAEIIVIALGTVADAPWPTRTAVLALVAVLMTVGVYGFVAAIVKLDDLGLWLMRGASGVGRRVGRGLLWLAPWLMRALAVLGTLAMFLVGGGILAHGLPFLGQAVQAVTQDLQPAFETLLAVAFDGMVGLMTGALLFLLLWLLQGLRARRAAR